MANNAGTGNRRRADALGNKLARNRSGPPTRLAEDDHMNPSTGRPLWDENAKTLPGKGAKVVDGSDRGGYPADLTAGGYYTTNGNHVGRDGSAAIKADRKMASTGHSVAGSGAESPSPNSRSDSASANHVVDQYVRQQSNRAGRLIGKA